jgi:hypothetical protein
MTPTTNGFARSAEQKLFDGASITASVGETPQGVTNKSLTAGFKRSW